MTDDRFFNFDTMQPGDSVTLLVSGTRPDEESGRWAKRTPVRVTRCAESYGRPADNFTYATDVGTDGMMKLVGFLATSVGLVLLIGWVGS